MSAKKTVRHIQNNFRLTTKLLSDSNILPVQKVLLKNNFPTYELPLHNPNSRPKKRKVNNDCPPCPPTKDTDCPEPENNYTGQTSYLHPRSRLFPRSKWEPKKKDLDFISEKSRLSDADKEYLVKDLSKDEEALKRAEFIMEFGGEEALEEDEDIQARVQANEKIRFAKAKDVKDISADDKKYNKYLNSKNEYGEDEIEFDPKKAVLLADFFSKLESGQLSKEKTNRKYSFGNPRKSSQSKRHIPTFQSSDIFGQSELEESAYIDDDGNYIPEKKKFHSLTEYKSECEYVDKKSLFKQMDEQFNQSNMEELTFVLFQHQFEYFSLNEIDRHQGIFGLKELIEPKKQYLKGYELVSEYNANIKYKEIKADLLPQKENPHYRLYTNCKNFIIERFYKIGKTENKNEFTHPQVIDKYFEIINPVDSASSKDTENHAYSIAWNLGKNSAIAKLPQDHKRDPKWNQLLKEVSDRIRDQRINKPLHEVLPVLIKNWNDGWSLQKQELDREVNKNGKVFDYNVGDYISYVSSNTTAGRMYREYATIIRINKFGKNSVSLEIKPETRNAHETLIVEEYSDIRKEKKGDTKETSLSKYSFDTVEFAELIKNKLLDESSKFDNNKLKTFFESHYTNLKHEKFLKEIQESCELALVMRSKEYGIDRTTKDAFNRILSLYNNQPTLNVRTSDSVARQAYSTPIPLGFLISDYLDLYSNTVYEPCAGNGSLTIRSLAKNVTVNEIDPIRINHLEHLGYKVMKGDALDITFDRKFARIVMNPPFGVYPASKHIKLNGKAITQIDQAIAIHSLQFLEPDGIASLILGGHTLTKDPRGGFKSTDQFFHNHLYRNYDILKCIDINGDLYRKQGTSFDIRLIILRNSNTPEYKHILPYQYGDKPGQVLKANTWEELYDFLSPENIPESATKHETITKKYLEESKKVNNEIEEEDRAKYHARSKAKPILSKLLPPSQKYFTKTDDWSMHIQPRLLDIVPQIPKLGTTDINEDSIAYLHIFASPKADLYVLEGNEQEVLLIGSVFSDGEFETGHYYLDEIWKHLKDIPNKNITFNLDFHFEPKKLKEINDSRNGYYKGDNNEDRNERDKENSSNANRESGRMVSERNEQGIIQGHGGYSGVTGSARSGTQDRYDDGEPGYSERDSKELTKGRKGTSGNSSVTQRDGMPGESGNANLQSDINSDFEFDPKKAAMMAAFFEKMNIR